MSEPATFDQAQLILSLPHCPKCGGLMWLVRIEPDVPGYEKRMFECSRCEHLAADVVEFN